MATTIRSDLIVPEVLAEAVQGEFANVKALYGTGAAVVSGKGFPSGAKGGDSIKVPYFGTIGEFEDLASNEGAGGAVPALTPAKITSDSDTASVQHSGKAFEITNWAQMAAMFEDPYAEAARQIREGAQRLFDAKLLAAAAATTLLLDIFDGATPANGMLDWQQVLDARALWGDEQEGIALVTMHSDVAFALLKKVKADGAGDTNEPLYPGVLEGTLLKVPALGVPIRVTDRETKTANYNASGETMYETRIYKRGALALWFDGGAPDIKTDSDILADTTVAAMHLYYVTHLYRRTPGATKKGVVTIRHNLPA